MMSNQGFTDFDRLRNRSPSPMASPNHMSNVHGAGLGSWNGLPPEVSILLYLFHAHVPLKFCVFVRDFLYLFVKEASLSSPIILIEHRNFLNRGWLTYSFVGGA